jgi:predicted RNA-binding Zn-ribbon protein involved in translation (DUF1610 family)
MNDDASSSTTAAPAAAATAEGGAGLAQLLRVAVSVPWESVDLDLPEHFVDVVGAELEQAEAIIACECSTKLRVKLNGATKARCPKCGTIFRHALCVQAEDAVPSSASSIVKAILDENVGAD